ncbi:hypothetical protein OK016_17320 [Vibrio chagasii]|nr:hypothetical protein [Vibrio chagasii]
MTQSKAAPYTSVNSGPQFEINTVEANIIDFVDNLNGCVNEIAIDSWCIPAKVPTKSAY